MEESKKRIPLPIKFILVKYKIFRLYFFGLENNNMKDYEFEHFRNLQNRYWKTLVPIDPKELIEIFTNKVDKIEKRDFGKNEDIFIITTQAKIILNGLSLKIYYFLKKSILYTEIKEYISAIALSRLCLEHLVMLSYFEEKLSAYLNENNFQGLQILLHSFCIGQRILFIDLLDKDTDKKIFTTRAEHVSSALRAFDKKYGGGVQLIYDMYSDHSHVTPTSSVRMLYRQKRWDENEPIVNFKNVKLSTLSNSNEKLASGGIETLLQIYKIVETNVINKEVELSKLLEVKGQVIELNSELNPNFNEALQKISYEHDKLIDGFFSKLKKYSEFKI